MNQTVIGNSIKNLMKKNNYTKEKMAREIGVTMNELEKILNGKKELSADQVLYITKIFNLSIEECVKIFYK